MHYRHKWLSCPALTLGLSLILSGCAGVQPVPVCPEIPELTARVPLGPSFQEEMRLLLRGSLPGPTFYEQDSEPATDTPTR